MKQSSDSSGGSPTDALVGAPSQADRDGDEVVAFGPFQFNFAARRLLRSGQPVHIGARALEVLAVLVESPGEVVTKKVLMARVWPYVLADESNLRVQIATLRKVFGDGKGAGRYLLNVAGHGYLFTEPVSRVRVDAAAPGYPPATSEPVAGSGVVGRDAIVQTLAEQVLARRLVTIVGPGGIGKSTVAAVVCQRIAADPSIIVHSVPLAAVDKPEGVSTAVATALGVSLDAEDPVASLIAFLKPHRAVIALDNCEHLVDAVAALVEAVLRGAPQVRFLATSREPLLASDEWVVRLPALAVPAPDERLTASEALTYPAIQLFVERAANSSSSFVFGDAEVAAVAQVCRQLDGLPLAIELVAARIELFGLRGLVGDVDERLMLVATGSRTAVPRHRSIRNTLEWSYNLLTAAEQTVLRRFSIFRGLFSLASALEVIADDGLASERVLGAVTTLAAKSLLTIDGAGGAPRYRLLNVTRAFAAEKLKAAGETAVLQHRHAQHFRDLLVAAESRWNVLGRAEWVAEYGYTIDDVRGALDWAFGPAGDVPTGAALTVAALPFGFQMSLIEEFRRRAVLALAQLAGLDPPNRLAELRITSALANLSLSVSVEQHQLEPLYERLQVLAEAVDEPRARIEPLLARAIFQLESGDILAAVKIVSELRAEAAAAGDPLAALLAERVAAQVHLLAGNHAVARELAESVMRHPARVIPLVYSQTSIDRRVSMRIVLARSYWLEGRANDAAAVMAESLEMARNDGPLAISFALGFGACPISFWSGDQVHAEPQVRELLDAAGRYMIRRWERLGACYAEALDGSRPGARLAWARSRPLVEPASPLQLELLATLDPRRVTEALVVRAEGGLCGWAGPEILRAGGDLALRTGADVATATIRYEAAHAAARAQGSRAWTLRAATSLAAVKAQQGECDLARRLLDDALRDVGDGHATNDTRLAVALRERLDG